MGFNRMTPVQAACVPLMLKRKDLAVEAVTGSGKTLAFLVPVTNFIMSMPLIPETFNNWNILVLILSPTRELVQQTYDVFSSILEKCKLPYAHCVLYGGCPLINDVVKLKDKRPSIIVSTPGRLVDLLKTQSADLKRSFRSLEFLLMDEADRLLDYGFEKSINYILDCLPKQRRTSLFSATQTSDLDRLIKAGLRNPVCITVKQESSIQQRTPIWLDNYYKVCQAADKYAFLVNFLQNTEAHKVIVFFNSGYGVVYFARLLKSFDIRGMKVYTMHRRTGSNRSATFKAFVNCDSKRSVLFSTDIVSRGVDIPSVDYVIQFDVPTKVNTFIHRCGRTARCNRKGVALILLLPNEDAFINFVRSNQNVPIKEWGVDEDARDDAMAEIKSMVFSTCEKGLKKRASRAFVSFINSYVNHELSLLFNVKQLDIQEVAHCYGLHVVPQLKELKTTGKLKLGNLSTGKKYMRRKKTKNTTSAGVKISV